MALGYSEINLLNKHFDNVNKCLEDLENFEKEKEAFL